MKCELFSEIVTLGIQVHPVCSLHIGVAFSQGIHAASSFLCQRVDKSLAPVDPADPYYLYLRSSKTF